MSQLLPVSINSSIPRPDERKAQGDQETTDAPFEEEDSPLDNGRYERMATKAAMAARLAALEEEHAATRRENAALKLALGSRPAAFEPSLTSSAAGTVTPPASTQQPTARTLSFTTATVPITDGRRDYYLGSVSKPRTVGSDAAGRMIVAPQPTTAPTIFTSAPVTTGLRVAIPAPRVFDGSGPVGELPGLLADFIRHVERFLHYSYEAAGHQPTPEEFLRHASLYLAGQALAVVEEMEIILHQQFTQTGVRVELTWTTVKVALEARFGRPQTPYDVLGAAMDVRQASNESVRAFAQRFDTLHLEMMRLGLDNRDLSARLFVRGLRDEIRERVTEVIASNAWFEREAIGARESRKAIAAILQISLAKEEIVANIRARRAWGTGQNQAGVRPSEASGQHGTKASGKKNKHKSKKNAKPSASASEADANRRIGIANDLYKARRAAGVCFRCNSAQHTVRECTSKVNHLPAPPSRRANTMNAEESDSEESEESMSGDE